MLAPIHVPTGHALEQLQGKFLGILPRLKQHFRIYFRHVACRDKRNDLVSEAIALSWRWFLRISEQGKDATQWPAALATFAARAIRSGRRVCGQERAKDAMSPVAQQRHGFTVNKLPDFSTLNENPLQEALADNTVSPVPDQVVFRCDFPEWLGTHSRRDRAVVLEMARGEKTNALARHFKISPARVSQLRRLFHDSWEQFTSDELIVA